MRLKRIEVLGTLFALSKLIGDSAVVEPVIKLRSVSIHFTLDIFVAACLREAVFL